MFILPIVCIGLTYLYYRYDLKKNIKIQYQYLLVILCFLLLIVAVFLPYSIYRLSRQIGILVVILLFYFLLGITNRATIKHQNRTVVYLLWLKIFMILYYVPIIIIKTFRHFPIGIIVTFCIVTMLVLLSILYFFIYLEKTRKWKLRNGIIVLSTLVFLVLMIGNVSILSSIRVLDDQKTLINLVFEMDDDYTSTRIAENTVSNDITYILDFAYFDDLLFFATNSMALTEQHGARIYVVDATRNEVIDEIVLSNGISFYTLDFMVYENQLYYTNSDGIFRWNGTTFSLYQELETRLNTFFLLENGVLACVGEAEENDFYIYQYNGSGFNRIDELDYTSQELSARFQTNQNELFIINDLDKTVYNYNKNLLYDYDIPGVSNEFLIGFIDEQVILKGWEDEGVYLVDARVSSTPSTYTILEESDISNNFEHFEDLLYITHYSTQIERSYLYNETLLEEYTFYPTYRNQRYLKLDKERMMMKEIESNLYYLLLTEKDGLTNFTFSRLNYDENQLTSELFHNINIESAFLVLVVLVTPMVIIDKRKTKTESKDLNLS